MQHKLYFEAVSSAQGVFAGPNTSKHPLWGAKHSESLVTE